MKSSRRPIKLLVEQRVNAGPSQRKRRRERCRSRPREQERGTTEKGRARPPCRGYMTAETRTYTHLTSSWLETYVRGRVVGSSALSSSRCSSPLARLRLSTSWLRVSMVVSKARLRCSVDDPPPATLPSLEVARPAATPPLALEAA